MARPTVMTPAVDAKARALAKGGLTLDAAAKVLGVNVSTLRLWARTRNVTFFKGQAVGRRFAATVMTAKREAQARAMAAEGASMSATAKALGVPLTALDNWSRRKGVAFTRQHGPARYGLTGQAAEDYALARRKGYSPSEALRLAGRPDLAMGAAA